MCIGVNANAALLCPLATGLAVELECFHSCSVAYDNAHLQGCRRVGNLLAKAKTCLPHASTSGTRMASCVSTVHMLCDLHQSAEALQHDKLQTCLAIHGVAQHSAASLQTLMQPVRSHVQAQFYMGMSL